MAKRATSTLLPSLLPVSGTLEELRERAAHCKACDLYKNATQTVFGEGAKHPRIMFVGEIPGDQEDLQGHPFVGPAGKLLDRALEEAGIDRSKTYIHEYREAFQLENHAASAAFTKRPPAPKSPPAIRGLIPKSPC